MKSKGGRDEELVSKHSGQGVSPLFSKKKPVVLPTMVWCHKDIRIGLQVDWKFL